MESTLELTAADFIDKSYQTKIAKVGDRWFVYDWDESRHQAVSTVSKRDGSRWFSNNESDDDIKYVGKAFTTKAAATRWAKQNGYNFND